MTNKEPNCVFRWLHLSDLHLVATASDRFSRDTILKGESNSPEANNMAEGGLSWYIQNHPVDCIVITGDFFLQGKFDDKNKNELKRFLEELYEICSDEGGWGWQRGDPMERIVWCPGNHDLNRDAATITDGKIVFRKEQIKKCEDRGSFSPGDHSELLTSVAFEEIFKFWNDRVSGGSQRIEVDGASPYEVQIYQMPAKNDGLKLFFLSLNTALAAGQMMTAEEETEAEAMRHFDAFWKAHHLQKSGDALKAYHDYHESLQKCFGRNADDEGRLCFISEDAVKAVEKYLDKQGDCLVIMFGHHPYSMLSEKAQHKFQDMRFRCCSPLYLHGHTHVVQAHTERIQLIGVGGLFQNPDDSYNQLSFSVGEIQEIDDGKYLYSIMLLFYTAKSYGDRQWAQIVEPITGNCTLKKPRRPGGRAPVNRGGGDEQGGEVAPTTGKQTGLDDALSASGELVSEKNKTIEQNDYSKKPQKEDETIHPNEENLRYRGLRELM